MIRVAIDVGTVSTVAVVPTVGVVVDEPTASLITQSRPWGARTCRQRSAAVREKRVRPAEAVDVLDPQVMRRVIGSVLAKLDRTPGPPWSLAVSVPVEMSEVARETLRLTVQDAAGGGLVVLVEVPDAVVLSLDPIDEDTTVLVADIGASRTQAAVVMLGAGMKPDATAVTILRSSARSVGSRDFDWAIRNWMADEHAMAVDDAAAEAMKQRCVSAWPSHDRPVDVRGPSPIAGVSRSVITAPDELRQVTRRVVDRIVGVIYVVLREHAKQPSEPQPSAIVLSGGGALLNGLDEWVARWTRLPTTVVDEPRLAVARGMTLCL